MLILRERDLGFEFDPCHSPQAAMLGAASLQMMEICLAAARPSSVIGEKEFLRFAFKLVQRMASSFGCAVVPFAMEPEPAAGDVPGPQAQASQGLC